MDTCHVARVTTEEEINDTGLVGWIGFSASDVGSFTKRMVDVV